MADPFESLKSIETVAGGWLHTMDDEY